MEEIDLPAVNPETSALDALDLMQSDGKSAVVVKLPRGPAVVSVGDLVRALRKGDVTVAEAAKLTTEEPFKDPLRGQVVYHAITSSSARYLANAAVKSKISNVLAKNGASLAVVSVGDNRAKVITDHEGRERSLATRATLCRCKTVRTHVFEPEDLLTPGKCNYPHQADVKCS
jgi:CBS domain-containing protein